MTDNQTMTDADKLVADVDTGARNPAGWQAKLIPVICFSWALYQLYIASPVPSMLSTALGVDFFQFIGNLSISRKIHLAFALVLATLAFPLFKTSSRTNIPWYDWVLLGIGVLAMLYMILMNTNIAERAGDFAHPNIKYDMTVAALGMIVLTLAVYRSLGLPLVIVAGVLAGYVFIGGGQLGRGLVCQRACGISGCRKKACSANPWRCRRKPYSCSCCLARSWKRPVRGAILSRSPLPCLAISRADQPRPLSSPRP